MTNMLYAARPGMRRWDHPRSCPCAAAAIRAPTHDIAQRERGNGEMGSPRRHYAPRSGPHVERIDDDEVVERRRVRAAGHHDRQGMGSVGEPRRFVDGVLIGFDRRSLEGIDLGLEHTVQVHVGDPGRELAAADPAYRGPGEGEGGRRARDTGFGDGPEAPGPVDVALDPAPGEADRGL